MILKELRLSHFGKFEQKKVSLKPGINIVYGKNEAGKSTMHSFIRGMLFGIERQRGRASKDDFYTKYLPWKANGAYEGTMDIVAGNKEYRLIRNFNKNHKEFRIIDLSTGREIEQKKNDISDIIPGLNESLYRNTVSIEQLHTGTDEELAMEVRNYIANLSVSKTKEVDVQRALNHLNAKRKEVQSELALLDTKNLSEKIERQLEELNRIDQLNEELLELEQKEKELREKKEEFLKDDQKVRDLDGDRIFAQIKAQIREYFDQVATLNDTNKEYNALTKTINEILRVENSHKTIYQDVEEVNQLHEKTHKLQNELGEIRRSEELLIKESKWGKKLYVLIPITCLVLLSHFVFGNVAAIYLWVILVICIIVMYLRKQSHLQTKLIELEEEEVRIDRECIDAEAKKREVYLRNNVTGDTELRYKMQMLRDNQEEFDDFKLKRYDVEKQQVRIYDRIERLEKEIVKCAKNYFSEVTVDDDLENDLEYEINLRKNTAKTELEQINKEYENVAIRLERLKWELSNCIEFEEELQRDQRRYKENLKNQEKLKKDLEAVVLAIESINALSIDIHDSFGDQINSRLSYIVDKVTHGRYTAVKMDENLNIKVLRDYDYISFDKLSAGAIAEIYLALRITVADILNGTKTLPLILDDAFVLYDDERLEATLKELNSISDRQIIIFTCHEREQAILNRLQLEYNYVDLSLT